MADLLLAVPRPPPLPPQKQIIIRAKQLVKKKKGEETKNLHKSKRIVEKWKQQ